MRRGETEQAAKRALGCRRWRQTVRGYGGRTSTRRDLQRPETSLHSVHNALDWTTLAAKCTIARRRGGGAAGRGGDIRAGGRSMSAGDVDVTTRADVDKLKGNAVGLYSILFLCVTGSAPLAVFIYNTPFTMPYGSGTNGPATFAFATIILTIFSIAYAEMAKKVRAAGGMYTYVSHGLGQAWGVMAGYSLMVGYAIFGVALIGGFSFYTQAKLTQYGWTPNWLWIAIIGVLLVV